MTGRWLGLVSTLLLATGAAGALPGDSIYQLPMQLILQDGTEIPLTALRGKPAVITMFYASCDGVCPMIAFSMRRMEAALATPQRARLQWLMVSFDPEHDSPEVLSEFASNHKLNTPHWRLARAAETSVRNLAAVLGIRYRKLPGGAFSHSTEIVLLDADGVIRARTSNLGQLDADFMSALNDELK